LATRTVNKIDQLQATVDSVIRGKPEVVELALVTLLADGHLLIEDVPGVGKTTLAQAIARSFDCSFQRIQFTSDLLPSDIVGLEVFNQQTGMFEFKSGPIFANVILADEINRTTPKTQSALLEAMAEGHITVEQDTYRLPKPFIVLATQNPVEHHGTYPLPEAQLDRFAMKLSIGYPEREDEVELLAEAIGDLTGIRSVERVLEVGQLEELQGQVARIAVSPKVRAYLADLGRATRSHAQVSLGLSPRGLLIWQRVAQAWAFLRQRPFVTPDDVQQVAQPVLSVRLGTTSEATANVLKQIVESVPVPV
jgi:MoxR-like ATPase